MIRMHLIAGKSLELSTTIIEKSNYEGLKTERLDNQQQSTPSYPVDHTVLVGGECSTTIPSLGFRNILI